MGILPILAAREVLRRLKRAGFQVISQRGSHTKLWNPMTDRSTGVPIHGSGTIDRGLLHKILKQSGLSVKDFLEL
jgi:predicted RNA binding protein YcfA (HicA-like mRNA interferase family)